MYSPHSSASRILQHKGFSICHLIGEGSYSKIYYAEQIDAFGETHKLACKVVNTVTAPQEYVNKFLEREIEILNKLNHPRVVYMTAILERRSMYYMFMTYASKGDLLDYLKIEGPVAEGRARKWFGQMVEGVQYLHAIDVAHRDLKCDNMLLTQNYDIIITDFGFSRMCSVGGSPVSSETFCGSLTYVPPEILMCKPYDPKKVDVWALGVTLYAMFNKALPFDGANLRQLLAAQMTRGWRFLAGDRVSSLARDVVQRLLEPQAGSRPDINAVWNMAWLAPYREAAAKREKRAQEQADSNPISENLLATDDRPGPSSRRTNAELKFEKESPKPNTIASLKMSKSDVTLQMATRESQTDATYRTSTSKTAL